MKNRLIVAFAATSLLASGVASAEKFLLIKKGGQLPETIGTSVEIAGGTLPRTSVFRDSSP